ncbi:hypothetical protein O6H91_17G024000 [Diphasiastrum complanatum]|uniref:Uncharacterized protein n=1 Tax=Diphasiastrum complanatum TaxID=34168 RepID=A0ACC2B4X3_DIPCM|nr:hypothetical protein O6H91_17G024000 [Diphasiastrum complanatum]
MHLSSSAHLFLDPVRELVQYDRLLISGLQHFSDSAQLHTFAASASFTCLHSRCLTCWLPCVAFGQIAQKVDDDQSSCFVNGLIYAVAWAVGAPCCYSCLYRHKMRAKFQLPEDPCNDFCTHCCCELLALCQEYRELQNRGIDPTLSSSQPRTIVMMAPGPATMQH